MFTGLYLQVFKNKSILKIICLIKNYHAFLLKNFIFKCENRYQHNELKTCGAVIDFKIGLFLQTCKNRPKRFIAFHLETQTLKCVAAKCFQLFLVNSGEASYVNVLLSLY